MTMTIGGTSGLVFPDSSTQNTAATGFGFKNRIINGAMMIDQRNAGASVTGNNGTFSVDRWRNVATQSSKFTVQQSTTAPTGFKNSLLVTSSSAYSVLTGDVFSLTQPIEGFNISDLGWGTSGASTVTLSFWVRSSLTGTFGGSLQNGATNRAYPFSYTINSANTFEQKTITITGDTTGTWATDNTQGILVSFALGAGSTFSGTAGAWAAANQYSATGATSVVGTNGATFYITGVQLEKGSTATSFDYRPYGTELQLCQRYYSKSMNMATVPTASNASAMPVFTAFSTSLAGGWASFPTTMRTTPTITVYSATGASGACQVFTNGASVTGTITIPEPTETGFRYISNSGPNFTSGVGYQFGYTSAAEL